MDEYFFNLNGHWKYNYDGTELRYKATSRDYDYGENQKGDPYYIKYTASGWDPNIRKFNLYPIEDDLYENDEGDILPVEWGKYYDPNDTWLPTLDVVPRTGTLTLNTWYPLSKEYPYTGHSALTINPDYMCTGKYRSVSKGGNEDDYNLVTNNCADDTRRVLETLLNKNMNPWFFTTPGDSRDFLMENGGTKMKDGSVKFRLSEDQLLKLVDYIDEMLDIDRDW